MQGKSIQYPPLQYPGKLFGMAPTGNVWGKIFSGISLQLCLMAPRYPAGNDSMMLNRPHRAANFLHLLAIFLMMMSCSAFGVEPEILLGIEKSGEPYVVEATIKVQAPLRTAWEVLTDFEHMNEWEVDHQWVDVDFTSAALRSGW